MNMSFQLAVELDDNQVAILDNEVESGRAQTRADAVRHIISYLDRYRGYRRDNEIMTRLRKNGEDIYPDFTNIPASDLSFLR